MKTRPKLVVGIAVIGLFGLCFLYRTQPPRPSEFTSQSDRGSITAATAPNRQCPVDLSQPASTNNMSDAEFLFLRVNLPTPKPNKWAGPFFDSSNCLDAKHSRAALDVLPGWIRKSILAGNSDQAAGYLHSLFELLKTDDADQQTDTALALYRLGSRDQRVMDTLRSVLMAESNRLVSNPFSQTTEMVSIRQAVLEHFEFYDDHSVDMAAKEALAAIVSEPDQNSARGVLARFLEKMGNPQPESIWLEQLGDPDGFMFAWKTLQKRSSKTLKQALQTLFNNEPDTLRGVVAAGILFEIGGDQVLERKLVERVEGALQDGKPDVALESALLGLLRGNSVIALTEAGKILASDNLVLHEIALQALSQSTNPAALGVITKYAKERAAEGYFPTVALQSLNQIEGARGEAMYTELKASLLASGHSESDFAVLEFDRKHRTRR